MNQGQLNLGAVEELAAESFGEPGARTFRLRATTASGQLELWLEKEQIVAFGEATEQILERVPASSGESIRPFSSPAEISGSVAAKAGSLSLAFDAAQDAFVIEASDLWEATLDVQSLVLLASRSQLTAIGDQVDEIVAGSRPRCPMCGRPMTEGAHFCPPSNGHARVREQGQES